MLKQDQPPFLLPRQMDRTQKLGADVSVGDAKGIWQFQTTADGIKTTQPVNNAQHFQEGSMWRFRLNLIAPHDVAENDQYLRSMSLSLLLLIITAVCAGYLLGKRSSGKSSQQTHIEV